MIMNYFRCFIMAKPQSKRNSLAGEEARRQLHKNVPGNIEQVLAATPHMALTIRSPASHHENYPR